MDVNDLLPPTPPSSGSGTARARRKKKPEIKVGSPEWWQRWLQWAFQRPGETIQSDSKRDIWICTACGAPMIYAKPAGGHGGPRTRGLDRRYGWTPCWRIAHRTDHRKDWPHDYGAYSLFRHDSAPNPEQPIQDARLQSLAPSFVDASRTYGTIPRVRQGVQPTALDRRTARPDGVRLVDPTDGRWVGLIRGLTVDEALPGLAAEFGPSRATDLTGPASPTE